MSPPRSDFPEDADPSRVSFAYRAEVHRIFEERVAARDAARDAALYEQLAGTERRVTESLGKVSTALNHLSARVDALDGRTYSIEQKDREAEERERAAAQEAAIVERVEEARREGLQEGRREAGAERGFSGARPLSNPSILVDAHGQPMPSSMPPPDPEATDERGMMVAIDTRPMARQPPPQAPPRPIAEGVGALLAASARVVDAFGENIKMLGALVAIVGGLSGGGTALTVLGIRAYQETLTAPAPAPASQPSPEGPTVLPFVLDAIDTARPLHEDTNDTGGDAAAAADTSRVRAR